MDAQKNPYRISAKAWFAENGYDDAESRQAALEGMVYGDENTPALCSEGCEVEPDGRCPHNCPSMLIALGMI